MRVQKNSHRREIEALERLHRFIEQKRAELTAKGLIEEMEHKDYSAMERAEVNARENGGIAGIKAMADYAAKHTACEKCGSRIGVETYRSAGKMQSICRSCRAKAQHTTVDRLAMAAKRTALRAKVNAAIHA